MYWTKQQLTEVVSISEETILYLESGRNVSGVISEFGDFYVVVASFEKGKVLYHKILYEQIDFPTTVAKPISLKKVKTDDNK